jgi:CRP-like cAMP-binding protein
MNQAINKGGLSTRDAGTANSGSNTGALAHILLEESCVKHKRTEIKSIPFSGLLTNKLLASLPGEEFASLLPHMEPVSCSAGNYLYGFGDEVEFIYFPETLIISHIHLLEDGNTTEVSLVGNEGMVGLSAIFGASSTSYWAQVIVAGSALRLQAEVVKQAFHEGRSLQRLILNYTNERIEQISQRAVCNVRHALGERLATWLLMIQDRAADPNLMLTHEEIARHMGARRASVSLAATLLRDKKIINYNRGRIRILDRQALIMSACECYRTLTRHAE